MKLITYLLLLMVFISCKAKDPEVVAEDIDALAKDYVRLALVIGQYDPSFVDAYYGPDSLKPQGEPKAVFPKDSLLLEVDFLIAKVLMIANHGPTDTIRNRAGWIADQMIAFGRRIKVYAGDGDDFDKESVDLFGAAAPVYDEEHYKSLVARLDSLLPDTGSVQNRFQSLANRFIIPKPKLDTVFRAAIAECRKRTREHFDLPAEEKFSLEYVNNVPWSGYNWYKGNYTSLIQINTDLNIFIDRAIDVGSHESYPGHHVYNMLLEKNLYHNNGLMEISMYPLFSPQSLIAEGTANYGIDVVFPGDDKVNFTRDVLLPLARLDTTGITMYYNALKIKGEMNYGRNEAARGLVNGTMTDEQAKAWMISYCLMNDETATKSISFIKANRSYVINYNYGMDLVKSYIESRIKDDPTPANRWKVFGELMSRQVRIKDLKS
ncbi:MAG: hypothetical protein M3R25_08620 [Bacteroidota bacterium]|nr:hypothetical protein [Bacteroidota bacterium]